MNRFQQALFSASSASAPPGFLRWSQLSTWGGSFPAAGAPLNLSGVNLLYDVQMADSSAPGVITLGAGASITVDPAFSNPRLVCAALLVANGGTGNFGTQSSAYGGNFTLDIGGTVTPGAVRGAQYTGNTPTANDGLTNDNFGRDRGIVVMAGGTLNMVGNSAPIITRAFTAIAGGQAYVDVDATVPSSMVGGKIMVTPDGFYNASRRTETFTVTSVAPVSGGTRVGISGTFGFARFAQKQYVVDSPTVTDQVGFLSLTPGTFSLRTGGNPGGMMADIGQTALIDYCRATVVIYKNNISVNGYDLAGGTNLANGDGVHTMQMGLTSRVYMKNLTLTNYGQKGLLGRYGIHVHIPSYNSDGTPKNDGSAVGNLNSAFGGGTYHCDYASNESHYEGIVGINGFNRFGVQHACRGVVFDSCIAKDAKGHAFFQETAAEEGNTINNCVSIGHADPGAGYRLQSHDATPYGFWFANLFNTLTNNIAVDSAGGGWANALSFGVAGVQTDPQHGCYGYATPVPIAPAYTRMGTWSNNNSLCYGAFCFTQPGQTRQDGTRNDSDYNGQPYAGASDQKVYATSDGLWPSGYHISASQLPNEVPIVLAGMNLHKGPAYVNVASAPKYLYPKQTDQLQTMWTGTTHQQSPTSLGGIFNPIVSYESLNHESHYLRTNNVFACAFTSYHGTEPILGATALNFTGEIYTTGGANNGAVQKMCVIESWDNYTDPNVVFSIAETPWCLGNSDGLWMTPASHLTEDTTLWDSITGTSNPGPKFCTYGATGNFVYHGWTLGCVFDRYGNRGQGPTNPGVPNSWIVFNHPFYTSGTTVVRSPDNNPQVVISTTDRMGINIQDDADTYVPSSTSDSTTPGRNAAEAIVQRVNPTTGAVITGASIDIRKLQSGQLTFHHQSCPVGGAALITWPGKSLPTTILNLQMEWINPSGGPERFPYANPNQPAGAAVTWGIQWGAATAHPTLYNTLAGGGTPFVSQTSLANLAAYSGNGFFFDSTNYICWLKIQSTQNFLYAYLQP